MRRKPRARPLLLNVAADPGEAVACPCEDSDNTLRVPTKCDKVAKRIGWVETLGTYQAAAGRTTAYSSEYGCDDGHRTILSWSVVE